MPYMIERRRGPILMNNRCKIWAFSTAADAKQAARLFADGLRIPFTGNFIIRHIEKEAITVKGRVDIARRKQAAEKRSKKHV